jgi:hypothetical protein
MRNELLRSVIWVCAWAFGRPPFEVGDRSWVYEHHKEWLVHNAAGVPLQIISRAESEDKQAILVLDTTKSQQSDQDSRAPTDIVVDKVRLN